MLTEQEKNELYSLIAAMVGDDPTIRAYKASFNDKTIAVVENMVADNEHCNQALQELVSDLLGGGRAISKGWLKRALGMANGVVNRTKLKGYGCLVAAKSRWKSQIIFSAM